MNTNKNLKYILKKFIDIRHWFLTIMFKSFSRFPSYHLYLFIHEKQEKEKLPAMLNNRRLVVSKELFFFVQDKGGYYSYTQ